MGIDGSEDTDWSKILWSMAKTGLVPLKKNQNSLTHLYRHTQEENLEQETSFNLGGVAEPRRPGLTRSNSTRRRKPNRNRPTSDGEPDINKKKQTGTLPWFLNLVGPPGNRLNNRCKLIMTNWITNSIYRTSRQRRARWGSRANGTPRITGTTGSSRRSWKYWTSRCSRAPRNARITRSTWYSRCFRYLFHHFTNN